MSNIQLVIVIAFLIATIVGFAVMAFDKYRAVKSKWRVPEKTLFVVALLGGAGGMFFAMHWLRHKNQKLKFSLGFPIIMVLHLWGAVILVL